MWKFLILLMLQKPPLLAVFTGPDADVVGPANSGPNGTPDWHVSAYYVREKPKRIRIENGVGGASGVWENPYNGTNWNLAMASGGAGALDLVFEPPPCGCNEGFNVILVYPDDTTEVARASNLMTLQNYLAYEVRQSRLPDIDGVANAERNGTVLMPYTAGKDLPASQNPGSDYAHAAPHPDGSGATYYRTVIVKDDAGNKRAYAMAPIVPPVPAPAPTDPAPTVSVVAPTNGALITTKTFTLKATASDKNADGVIVTPWKLSLYVNSLLVKECSCEDVSFAWNTSPYKGQVVRIVATARDLNGSAVTTPVVTVTVKK